MRGRFLVSSFWFLVFRAERDPAWLRNQKPETRNQKPHRRVAAFTLVEVLAALAFLGLVIPVAVGAIMVANRASVASERTLIATQLGENRLNELMLAQEWETADSRGDFGEDHPDYRWELKKNDWQAGSMTELDFEVFFKVQGTERSVRLSTLVSEDIGGEGAPE